MCEWRECREARSIWSFCKADLLRPETGPESIWQGPARIWLQLCLIDLRTKSEGGKSQACPRSTFLGRKRVKFSKMGRKQVQLYSSCMGRGRVTIFSFGTGKRHGLSIQRKLVHCFGAIKFSLRIFWRALFQNSVTHFLQSQAPSIRNGLQSFEEKCSVRDLGEKQICEEK